MDKLEKDGKVAVLISPGYGAGWSTWNGKMRDEMLFDPEIAQAVLDGDNEKAAAIAGRKYHDGCLLGAADLVVEWVDKGAAFEVEEYDGSESLHIIGDRSYVVA